MPQELGLAVLVLGATTLVVDGVVVVVARTQVRQALSLFAAATDHHVTTDQLVDALWPDVLPANPSAAVRVILTRLRASLGQHGDALIRIGSSYELHASYDIDLFLEGIEQGFAAYDRGDSAGAHHHLMASYALWRGDPIPDLPVESPLTRTRLTLTEQRTTLVARLTRVQCALGDHERAVATISPLLSVVHENEILAVAAAEALAGAGRRGEALVVINRTRSRLRSQGIGPSPALGEIERTILTKPSDLRPAPMLGADDSEVFVGRTAELAALSRSDARVSTVEGDAGFGKSVLTGAILDVVSGHCEGQFDVSIQIL